MSLENKSPSDRLEALQELLEGGRAGSQEEIREKLETQGFVVTQSTVSRDLRRLGAVKNLDEDGRTVYRLATETAPPPLKGPSLGDLISSIDTNGSIVVIHTTPGSANLVARHLDHYRPGGILGTIAGDDTIFVAPGAANQVEATIGAIRQSLT
jgi:transcriptional regulator of arginine metabolism